jgi:hypothetical protein
MFNPAIPVPFAETPIGEVTVLAAISQGDLDFPDNYAVRVIGDRVRG